MQLRHQSPVGDFIRKLKGDRSLWGRTVGGGGSLWPVTRCGGSEGGTEWLLRAPEKDGLQGARGDRGRGTHSWVLRVILGKSFTTSALGGSAHWLWPFPPGALGGGAACCPLDGHGVVGRGPRRELLDEARRWLWSGALTTPSLRHLWILLRGRGAKLGAKVPGGTWARREGSVAGSCVGVWGASGVSQPDSQEWSVARGGDRSCAHFAVQLNFLPHQLHFKRGGA